MIQPIGFIKLHRELASKPIWLKSTAEQKVILLTLLMMANFNPNQWEWKGEKYEVKPGQFITSLDSIVKECGKGISTQNVRTALSRFEKLGFLTNEPTKEGRLVTIANWSLYQCDNKQPNKPNNKELTNDSQTPNKDLTPKEECNNVKNEKKKDVYITCQHLTMTESEYNKLVDAYGKIKVDDKIEYCDNYAKLKNYKSLYKTVNNWLKADATKSEEQVGINSARLIDDNPFNNRGAV